MCLPSFRHFKCVNWRGNLIQMELLSLLLPFVWQTNRWNESLKSPHYLTRPVISPSLLRRLLQNCRFKSQTGQEKEKERESFCLTLKEFWTDGCQNDKKYFALISPLSSGDCFITHTHTLPPKEPLSGSCLNRSSRVKLWHPGFLVFWLAEKLCSANHR